MRRILTLSVLCLTIIGCVDRTISHLTSPASVSNLTIPAEGDPTYYSSTVNTTYYGGYPGYDNPDAARSAVFTEEFIWSSASSFWDIRESFSSSYGPFGAESADERGVSQAVRTRADLIAYDRTGQVIYRPDTTFALNSAPPDASEAILVQPSMSSSIDRSPSEAGKSSNVPPITPVQQALDGRIVTPEAAARALAQLRKTATQMSSNADKTDFEIRRGANRCLLTFATAYGAVTHARVEDANGTVAETDYQYSAVPGGFVLTEERETIHLPGAPKPLTIIRKYSDGSIR